MDPRHLINTYGAFQLAAVAAFLLLLHFALRRRGAGLASYGWLAGLCVLAAGIGGRLHFLIEGLAAGRITSRDLGAALSPAASGSTFFGAMLGVALVLLAARRRIPGGSLARLADDAVPGIGIAILIGRLGCLSHGCCLGEPSGLPWALPAGLAFGSDAVMLHPLPLYLGLWALASSGAAALLVGRVGRGRPAIRFLTFVMIFALGRGAIESLRLAPPAEIAARSWAGWESLVVAAIALAALVALHRSHGVASTASSRTQVARKRSRVAGSPTKIWRGKDLDGLRPLE
jgi:prolipoprotein diacylglyceryltransferase